MAHATVTIHMIVYVSIQYFDKTRQDKTLLVEASSCQSRPQVTTPTFKPNTLMVKVSVTDELASPTSQSRQRKAGAHTPNS
jgi:hypothetical protein